MNAQKYQEKVNAIMNGPGTTKDKERMMQDLIQQNQSVQPQDDKTYLEGVVQTGINIYIINAIFALFAFAYVMVLLN